MQTLLPRLGHGHRLGNADDYRAVRGRAVVANINRPAIRPCPRTGGRECRQQREQIDRAFKHFGLRKAVPLTAWRMVQSDFFKPVPQFSGCQNAVPKLLCAFSPQRWRNSFKFQLFRTVPLSAFRPPSSVLCRPISDACPPLPASHYALSYFSVLGFKLFRMSAFQFSRKSVVRPPSSAVSSP